MRFSTATLLALPLLAAATQEASPLDQAKAQAEYWLGKIASYIPNPNKPHSPQEPAAKAGGRTLNILTLNDWEQTIRSSVKPASTKPEEWWILVTGGNKTCFGQCGQIEKAFNETALLWSLNPSAPHLGYLNCEAQPVLCNAWSSGPPGLQIFELPPPPGKVTVRLRNLNITTTTVKTFTDLHASKAWKEQPPYEGMFHPFDGFFAQYGLAVPLGYFFWIFSIIPSWAFMIGVSFLSRTIMSNRMGTQPTRPAAGAAPAGGAAAAPAR